MSKYSKDSTEVTETVVDLEGTPLTGSDDLSSVRYGSFTSLETQDMLALNSNITNDVPQGRHLGVFSTIVMFVARIVGSGIFATPSSIFVNCGGNPVLFMSIWIIAALMAFAGLYLFLEFGCLLPRSGGRKNFLEAVYDKPKLMTSVTFSSFAVLTGFSISSAIIFGKYVLFSLGFSEKFVNEESNLSNYLGSMMVLIIVFVHGVSVKHGIIIQNMLGALKFLLIAIICVSGVYALFVFNPKERIEAPITMPWHFQDSALVSCSSLTAAFIQAFFCFAGWDGVHTVTSEIKNPVRTLKIAGPTSLFIALICYTLLNLGYLKVLTFEEIKAAGPLVGSLFFSKIYGQRFGRQFVTLSIALSAVSNLFVVIYSISRMNQEIFREGYLPFSKQMATNWPWGAPFPSLILCGLITTLWLVLLPAGGESYNYLVSMEGYANQFFLLLVAVGLFIYRKRHPEKIAEIRASMAGGIALIVMSIYLMIGPFLGDQSKNSIGWFPPYQITATLMILACFLFWLVKFKIIPYILGYELQAEMVILEDGLVIKKWNRVYINAGY